ncbi:cystathionine gamma-synthase 1, chloroplastic-like [Iris pallida]|uniref:Cystathionine gamma-synthase 1, chloroplastic-like n=1 Tax=Iris pallida TaxID=29817 RepID=A0AAX6FGF2_IRIPA|nr:cystathionine gamma-synthase 1, chloroplastic-like [Iris pallida]
MAVLSATAASFNPKISSSSSAFGSGSRPGSPKIRFLDGGIGLSSAMILRFPPNFVRQLSTKARRNCGNIGVAQVVAASWTGSSSAAASTAAAEVAAADGFGIDVNGLSTAVGGGDCVHTKVDAADDVRSVLSSDGSLAVHAGERFGRGITTDSITPRWFKRLLTGSRTAKN